MLPKECGKINVVDNQLQNSRAVLFYISRYLIRIIKYTIPNSYLLLIYLHESSYLNR